MSPIICQVADVAVLCDTNAPTNTPSHLFKAAPKAPPKAAPKKPRAAPKAKPETKPKPAVVIKLQGATKSPASRTRQPRASAVKSGRIAKSAPKSKLSKATQADPHDISSGDSDETSGIKNSAQESIELGESEDFLGGNEHA